MSRKSVPLS